MKPNWNLSLNLLIVILVMILMIERCTEEPTRLPKEIRDTTYIVIRDTAPGKVVYLKGEVDTQWFSKPEYIPDINYDSLFKQYFALGEKHFMTNTFSTTFPIEGLGSVTVKDIIKENKLLKSDIFTDLSIPIVTVTKEAPPRRQIYVGGALIGNPEDLINGAQVGGLYKDRRDRMFGLHAGYDFKNQTVQYSASTYWKINLRKD